MPKIVFIHGSPRPRGNTRTLAGWAMDAARQAGGTVTEINPDKLAFKAPGCISCYKCQQSDSFRCAVDDELGRTVGTLPDFDACVLATPIYWFSFPAQLKMFIDRMFSLIKFDGQGIRTPLEGKTFGLLATGGGEVEDNLSLLERQWSKPAGYARSPFVSCLIPNTTYNPRELSAKAREKAETFGRSLVQG